MKGVGKVFEAVSTFYFNFRSFHKIFRRNDDYGNPLRIPRPPTPLLSQWICVSWEWEGRQSGEEGEARVAPSGSTAQHSDQTQLACETLPRGLGPLNTRISFSPSLSLSLSHLFACLGRAWASYLLLFDFMASLKCLTWATLSRHTPLPMPHQTTPTLCSLIIHCHCLSTRPSRSWRRYPLLSNALH